MDDRFIEWQQACNAVPGIAFVYDFHCEAIKASRRAMARRDVERRENIVKALGIEPYFCGDFS